LEYGAFSLVRSLMFKSTRTEGDRNRWMVDFCGLWVNPKK